MASIAELTEKAREELARITSLDPSSAIGVVKDGENWRIIIEMVEKHSVPDQMDILAIYEVVLDDEGNMLEFKRKGLRRRVETDLSEGI